MKEMESLNPWKRVGIQHPSPFSSKIMASIPADQVLKVESVIRIQKALQLSVKMKHDFVKTTGNNPFPSENKAPNERFSHSRFFELVCWESEENVKFLTDCRDPPKIVKIFNSYKNF